eukprot:scaffold13803_cov51-Cyclotella_meneghiniana.AAC.3
MLRMEKTGRQAWVNHEARSLILRLLSFLIKYGLIVTQKYVQRQIETVLERFCWGLGDEDDFNIATVKEIVDICRPFKLRDEIHTATNEPLNKEEGSKEKVVKGIYQSSNCDNLWAQISSCIEEDFSDIPLEEINNDYPSIKDGLRIRNVDSDRNRRHEPATMTQIQAAVSDNVNNLIPFVAGSGNFSRSYQLKMNELHMIFETHLSLDNENAVYFRPSDDYSELPKAMPNLRYSEPDITVVVGNCDEAKEFQCHAVLLSFASAKLDHPRSLHPIVNLLKCIVGKGFNEIQQRAELKFKELLDNDDGQLNMLLGNYEFEVSCTKDLVSICLPISRVLAGDAFTSESCPILWHGIISYLTYPTGNHLDEGVAYNNFSSSCHKSVTDIGEGIELQSGIMTVSEVNLCCCKGLSFERRNENGIVRSNISARECVAGRVKIDDDAPNTRAEVNVVAGNDDCCMARESLKSFEAISTESGESLESMKAISIETGVSLEVNETSSFIVGPKERQYQHDEVVGPRRRQYQHIEVVGPVERLDQRNEMSHQSIETVEVVGPDRRLHQHDDDIVGPERRLHQLLFWIVHAETSEVENGSGRRLYHLVRNDILGMELEASESFAARIIELKNVTQGEFDTREYITRVHASIEPSCDDCNIARVKMNREDSKTCGVACGVELNVSVDAHTSADEVDGKERNRAGRAIVNAGMTCMNTKHGRVLYGCTWHSFVEDDEAGADVISGGAESYRMTWADIAHEVDQSDYVLSRSVGRIPTPDIIVGEHTRMKQSWIAHRLAMAICSNIEQGRVFEFDQHSHNQSIWSDLYTDELNDGVDAEPRADIANVRLFQKSDKIQSVVEEADGEVMSTDVQVSLDLSDMQILSANRLNVDFKRKHALLWIKNELDRIGTVVKLMTSTGKRAKEHVTSFANWSKGGQVRQILHQDDYANWSKGGRVRMSVEEPFCFLRSQLLANRGMDVYSKYRVLNLELGRVSDGVLSQVSVLMEMTNDLYYVTYFVLFYVLNIMKSNVSLLLVTLERELSESVK